MIKDKKIITLFILAIAGFLFSGYMSSVKFFTNTCAFNETCPYFLGIPACYFGFAMFTVIFIASFATLFKLIEIKNGIRWMLSFSILGNLFAGYFSAIEIPVWIESGFRTYFFGLPTCTLGLVFFVLILIFAFLAKRGINKQV